MILVDLRCQFGLVQKARGWENARVDIIGAPAILAGVIFSKKTQINIMQLGNTRKHNSPSVV